MFGRVARLPVDFNSTCNYDVDAKLQDFMDAKCLRMIQNGKNPKKQSKFTVMVGR